MKNTFTKFISKLLLILCFLFTGYQGFAQYTATTIATGGGEYPAMAKDQSNNIYVVRLTSGVNYEVVKFTGGDPAVATVLITGLNAGSGSLIFSWGLAVNSSGDVFVTNANQDDGWEIIKWRAATGTSAVIHTGNYYSSLAIDNSDNLLSLEYDGVSNYQVWKYPAGAEGSTGSLVYNGITYPGPTLTYPWGLSVDSHNDIFFLGFLETNGGSLYKLSYPSYSLTTLGTNKSYTALTIDDNDNLYTSEGIDATTAQVVKYTYPVTVGATGTSIYAGLASAAPTYPWGLAVNSSGQIFANDGAASGSGRIVRLDPPTSLVSAVTRLNSTPTAATIVTYAVIFNKSVTGVTPSSFGLTTSGSVTGAAVSGVSGSGTTYVVSVNTGTGDGTIRLNVTGTGVVPTTTNVPYTSGPAYTIDKTPPVGSIVINSGATLTNNATVTLTLAATDASGIQMRFSNDGSAWSSYQAYATSKSWALSAGDGLKTVYVQYGDNAGNIQGYNSTITLDQTVPVTTILTGPASLTNSTSATFTFSSNEAGSTFQGSIDAGPFNPISSPATYSGLTDGAHSVLVRAKDPAGNFSTPVAYNWTVDQTAPTVASVGVPANGYYVIGSSMNFVVNYSENVVLDVTGGTPYLNVILNSGTVQASYVSGSGTSALTFTYVVVDGDADMDGPSLGANLQTNGATINDAAGNTADVTLQNPGSLSGVFVNTTRPTVTLASSELPLLNHAITATITFSEAVTGFTSGDIQATNATITAFTTSDNITYSITATPVTDGPVSLSVPASVALNVAGNPNQASTNTLSFTYDITKPVVSSVSAPADGYYKAGDNLGFTVTFDGAVAVNTTGGNPYLNVTIGSSVVHATLISTTANALNFAYTVVDGDQDMDGIAVGSLVLNGSTIKDAAGNNATLTLNNIASTANVFVNTTHPSVVLSSTLSVVNAPFTATITFSEAVTGFAIGDITAGNGTLSNLQTSDNITYTVLVTPTAEGSVTLNVAADVAVNIGNNGNTYAAQLNVLYDITPPAVTSVSVPANGYYVTGNNMNFTVTFSEPIAMSFAGSTPYLNITIGSSVVQATYISGTTTSLTFRYTVVDGDQDMDGIAVNSLNLNGHTIKDGAGNDLTLTLNNVGNTSGVFVNTAHPSVVVSTTAPAIVNAPYTATITFSEAVTGFTIGDITKTNATLSNLQTADNITYTVLVTPTANGNVSVAVGANVAVNIANNGNAASNTILVMYDATAPTITTVGVPANGYYKLGAALNFTVNYSENVIVDVTGGTPYLNVVLATGTVHASYVSGSGTSALTFSYTVQSGDLDMDGPSLGTNLQTNGGTIRDAATNDADVTLQNVGSLTGVFVDGIKPAVVVSTAAPALVNQAITATITFSEAVTGLTTGDFVTTNATVSNLQTSDNITYTVLVTPVADGAVDISVPAAVAQDVAGNDNTASNTISFTYDGTAPVVTSVAVPANGYYKAGTTLGFTVNFDGNIILNTTGGTPYINVTIGSSVVQAACTGTSGSAALTFSYTVQNGDMDMDGITVGSLVLNGGTIKDAATNNAVLTLNNTGSTTGVFVNTAQPTVVVSTTAAAKVNAPFTATITFNEAVTGFAIGDIVTSNATLSNLQTSDNITYTVLVTPTAEGIVTVNVPANAAVNIGNNGNTVSNTLSVTYDITAPVVTVVTVPANYYYKAGSNLAFTVQFSENIVLNTTGGNPYINVTIGSTVVQASFLGTSGLQALNFLYTVQNGDMDMDGITVGSLVLNGSTIKDAATNDAVLTLNNTGSTAGVFVNTSHPSVVLSTAAAAIVNTPFTATITFSEAVTGFAIGDIVVSNATLSNLQTTDNITYTVLVTPVTDGAVSVNVPATVAVNIGNNDNTASNSLSVMYDATAPVVTSVAVPANGYYKDGTTLNFVVNYSENVIVNTATGVPYINVALTTGGVNAAYVSGSGTSALVFSYTVQPGDMDMDGITVVSLVRNGGSIKDVATNNAVVTLNNIASTAGVFVNTATPLVYISTTAGVIVNTPFTVQLSFTEAVTGLTSSDITASNATVSNLQTTDNIVYTALITPFADGVVNVNVPAGSAVNVVGNGNSGNNLLAIVYDATAPVIATGLTFNIAERSPVGTLVGTVTAVEARGTLQNWTIASDDSGGAFSIDNTGSIHVQNVALLNSKANSTVTLTITVSDGLNTSIAETVTVNVKLVNQAPLLDPVSSVVMCTNTDSHTIQLTGASAVETDQTYGFSVSADKPNFDVLSVSAAGLITYQLKAGTSGITTVTVTIKDNGGTANGGVDTSRRTFTITANSLPLISISSDKGNAISKGDIVHLTATGGTSYSWNNADGNISGQLTDILEARPMENTTYSVTVTDAEGCSDSATISVKVVEDFKVDAINILTPNGDGKNDKWVIKNIDSYPNNEVRIFDRTGRLVYTRRNYNNEWDGTMNGSALPEGTYYYILTIEGGKTAKGYITIIRDRN
ncbi:gliding motility-associated C-terminal domain-containing protein [Chitinophaga sp. YR573]|uniref:Ig-like domain-containing protein n=1 Tax=Chitinophaga sp. YR573 TaxID=1881040 RepID=UPI0008ACC323|nr:Ig-like domain-containing protein [Chitinophaga sp. YR573]SEW36554.1 gliding motility-associated C-terminal domain-containing protein [Chitinophaga sp. YR573]